MAVHPPVGHKVNVVTACGKLVSERMGRKQMAPGSAGGDEDRLA